MKKKVFVTVGTQLPFDRLVEAVDKWCEHRTGIEVIAQTGNSSYVPRNFASQAFMHPEETAQLLANADVVFSHAGMGTIIQRIECGRPILVLARAARLNEHRNDHQLDTLRRLSHHPLVIPIKDESDLDCAYVRSLRLNSGQGTPLRTSQALLESIRSFCK